MAPSPTKVLGLPDTHKTTTAAAQVSTSVHRVAQLTGHLAPETETDRENTRSQLPIDYPVSRLQLDPSHHVDDVRPLRVAVVGAGLSGITAGILLPQKTPGIDLTIYEKNNNVSGTWLENVYPGVQCDIPAHVYQSTFEPNTQWSEIFAKGAEIRDYWQSVAKKHNVYRYVKLQHRVDEAVWDDDLSKWALSVINLNTKDTSTQTFDFLILAIGRCTSHASCAVVARPCSLVYFADSRLQSTLGNCPTTPELTNTKAICGIHPTGTALSNQMARRWPSSEMVPVDFRSFQICSSSPSTSPTLSGTRPGLRRRGPAMSAPSNLSLTPRKFATRSRTQTPMSNSGKNLKRSTGDAFEPWCEARRRIEI